MVIAARFVTPPEDPTRRDIDEDGKANSGRIGDQVGRVVDVLHGTEPVRDLEQLHGEKGECGGDQPRPPVAGGRVDGREVQGERDCDVARVCVQDILERAVVAGLEHEHGGPEDNQHHVAHGRDPPQIRAGFSASRRSRSRAPRLPPAMRTRSSWSSVAV
jgi:hypothetical protein